MLDNTKSGAGMYVISSIWPYEYQAGMHTLCGHISTRQEYADTICITPVHVARY